MLEKRKCFLKGVFLSILLVFFLLLLSCKTIDKKNKKTLSLPPRKIGVFTAAVIKRNTKTLLARDFSLVLITRTETLRIHHKLLGDNVWIFFPPKERKNLIIAIEEYLKNYKDGFDDGKRRLAYFGKEKIQMVWGLLNVAHRAYPTVRFEYELLKNDKPYFIIANTTVESEKNDANAPALRIALSPKQCRVLLNLINDDAISLIMQNLKKDFEDYDDHDFEDRNSEEKTESFSNDENLEEEDVDSNDFE